MSAGRAVPRRAQQGREQGPATGGPQSLVACGICWSAKTQVIRHREESESSRTALYQVPNANCLAKSEWRMAKRRPSSHLRQLDLGAAALACGGGCDGQADFDLQPMRRDIARGHGAAMYGDGVAHDRQSQAH